MRGHGGRAGAVAQYLEELSQGDPVAVGFTIVFALLLGFVGAVWVIDQRRKQTEIEKEKRRRRSGY